MFYEAVIGLEVHVQLRTRSKIFCRCENRFGAEPNTLVCPVCLGYPGTLPVLNHEAVNLALKLAMALDCTIHQRSVFARKNYFYADLPKGYQISQFDRPLAEGGSLPLASGGRIHIHRLHLEEDAGKLLHELPGGAPLPGRSLIDFNRCGVPLVEVVTEPELSSASEAQEYLQTLHQVLLFTATSDGSLEEGSLRCDANVSMRPRGEQRLGTKAEVKNLNSFRYVSRALEYEIERQTAILEAGGEVAQETRSFDPASGTTRTLRGKEEAHDYRYFPEPDLAPLVVDRERMRVLRQELSELPWTTRERFVNEDGLAAEDAALLCASPELAAYYEAVARGCPAAPQAVANWVRTEVLRELKTRHATLAEAVAPGRLAELIALVHSGELSNSAAKEVLGEIWSSRETPREAMSRLGLLQVRDQGQISDWVGEVVRHHPGPVDQYRAGKSQVMAFLVGQVMKRSRGRAEPQQVQQLLRRAIEGDGGREAPSS